MVLLLIPMKGSTKDHVMIQSALFEKVGKEELLNVCHFKNVRLGTTTFRYLLEEKWREESNNYFMYMLLDGEKTVEEDWGRCIGKFNGPVIIKRKDGKDFSNEDLLFLKGASEKWLL